MFEEDARDALIKYLGYVIPSEEPVAAQEPVVESAQVPPTSQPTITAEDLFAASPMSENLSEPGVRQGRIVGAARGKEIASHFGR